MTEELYINNKRVDMNADTKITLNFKSNILGDISKITSSNSQTISLPKTNHNRNIFDDPTSPSRSSSFPRRKHPARYVKNGVTVIADAYAVLLDCSDKYEIALYWGEMTKFQDWVNSGSKLNDLPSLAGITQYWTRANSEPDGGCYVLSDGKIICASNEDYIFYAAYDTGVGSWWTMNSAAQGVVAPLPFLSARKILSLIQKDNGLTFDFPAKFVEERYGILRRVAVHLSSRKSSVPEIKTATVRNLGGQKKGEFYYQGGLLATFPASSAYTTEDKQFTVNIFGDKSTGTHVKFNVDGRVRISVIAEIGISVGKWEHDVHQQQSTPSGFVIATVYKNGNRISGIQTYSSKDDFVSKSGLRYVYNCTCRIAGEFDVVKGDEIVVNFQSEGKFYTFANWNAPIWSGSSFQITPPAAEINASLGELFRANGNLPDIKQVDFVKAIAAMFGLYVIPSGVANKLKFVSLDMLLTNTSNAVDWSSKLVSNGDGDPSKIKYSWGEYCRRNKFTYKSTDDVAASGDGEITIDNDALDAEKQIVKLPFTASDEVVVHTDNGERGVVIPHFERGNDGQITDKKVDPRVVMIVPEAGDTGKAIAQFTPITFNQLLDVYYQTMRRLLNDAIVITEKIRLNEFDLLSLDFTKPVYLRQYGKYYGVVSVQASGNECTVQLLQLPSAQSNVDGGVFYSIDGGQTYTATVPANPVNLKVFTIATSIGNEDIRTLSAFSTLKRLDLSDVDFVDPDTGETIGDANGESTLFDDNAEHITFPRNVSAIGDKCCQDLSNLRTVTLPASIRSIGCESFDSSQLRAVDIPASLTELKQYAFWGCRYLHTIICRALTVPDTALSVFNNAAANIYGDKRVFVPNVDAYMNNAVWATLSKTLGFTFHPLSEANELAVNEIKLTADTANGKVRVDASAPVASTIVVVYKVTLSGQTLTDTVTISQDATSGEKSANFDSVAVQQLSIKSDSVFRYVLILK